MSVGRFFVFREIRVRLFGSFEKVIEQDDGTVKVYGHASSEAVDADGEIVKASAMSAAMPDYLKFGAVREMHQSVAAGTAIEMEVKTDGRTWFGAHVVDPIAVKKVYAKVYKGFSIGGRVTSRDTENPKMITGLTLNEISLVDRPANPEATFALFKADGIPAPAEKTAEDDDVEKARSGKDKLPTKVGETTMTPIPEAASPADKPAETSQSARTESSPDDKATPSAAAEGAATPVKEKVAKSMYGVANLAGMLDSLRYITQDAEWEKEWEQDGSPVPAQLRAWVALGAEILVAMTAEETAELVASLQPANAEPILLAAENDDLEKKGARNSAADQKKIQTVHDHSVSLGADCSAAKAASPDDLQKIAADATDALAKVTTERDTLEKRVKEFEAQPAAPKGVLKIVEKTDDSKDAAIPAVDPNDPLAVMKSIHATGGKRIVLS